MKKNKSLNRVLVVGILILLLLIIGRNVDFIKGIASQEASVAELSYPVAKEIEVGNAYNANGCKNEYYKGTKKPYPVHSIKTGSVNSLSNYVPMKYYGLSSVKLNIPKGYTAFIGTKGSSNEKLRNVGFTLTNKDGSSCINLSSYNDKGDAILVAPKCTLIVYGGVGGNGNFVNAAKAAVDSFKASNPEKDVLVLSKNGFEKADEAGNSASRDVDLAKSEKSQKIMGIFHSISSIGAFNRGIKSGGNMKVVLFDPPYDVDSLKYAPWFSWGNPGEIRKAVKNGIVSSPDILDITKGKATDPAHSDTTPLNGIISTWLNANCK